MKKAHKLKNWSCKKAKKSRDLVCRELLDHMNDVVTLPTKLKAKVKDVLLQALLSRKPEYMRWKKLITKFLKGFFECKPVLLDKDELKSVIESKTGYDLESVLNYVEVNIARRVIAMRVNPWTQAKQFLKSRPGCNKSFALSFREMSFDRKFFEDIVGDEIPNIHTALSNKEAKRYAKADKQRKAFFEKFPEDFYHSWSSKTDDLMFWAIMTEDPLRDLRKSAMKLVNDRELFDETYTSKKWPVDVEKMKWSKLVIKAAMLGKDNMWLHSQFAMWLENELALDNINSLEQDWELKFITHPEDFDVRAMREF